MMVRARWVTLVVAFAFAVFATSALAGTITVGLQEAGVNGGAITTEGSGGSSVAVGPIAYGSFTINTVTAVATPSEGVLDSNSLNVSGSTAGTLVVYVTGQGITYPTGTSPFFSSFTTNLLQSGWTVTEATYVDAANGLFTTATPLASKTFTASGLDTGSSTNSATVGAGPYSITEVYTIAASGTGSANSTIDVSAAEPASVGLLGLVLLGGLLVERKKLFA